jgi:hypothetical protein
MTISRMTLSIMTLSIMTLSILTLSTMTLRIMTLIITIRKKCDTRHNDNMLIIVYAKWLDAECF